MSYFKELVTKAKITISKIVDLTALEDYRVKFLGKNGLLTLKRNNILNFPIQERKTIVASINDAQKEIEQALNTRKIELKNICLSQETIDISLPGRRSNSSGGLHPISHVINIITQFFMTLNFNIITGVEIEDEYHNFDALNIPFNHPARTKQDTFWLDETRLLRTQTSSIQIRTMKNHNPPIRIISPGRVYRRDYDKTHTPMFHQVEGLVVDSNINFRMLKGILHNFLNFFFQDNIQISFRPSYFPFTEPSAEVYMMNKTGKWIEVLGCGMIHPIVLNNVGINEESYSGFAFGIGIERLAMLLYNVTDLRTFFENDLRFLKQFK